MVMGNNSFRYCTTESRCQLVHTVSVFRIDAIGYISFSTETLFSSLIYARGAVSKTFCSLSKYTTYDTVPRMTMLYETFWDLSILLHEVLFFV